ncbi:MAG: AAA family ATPase, partial [Anaerolineae bacterium]
MPGLKFHKLDLHTHTPASKCYNYPEHTPELIVQTAIARDLNAIAITDHNTASWIDVMKQAVQGTRLVIFPGVEISLSEGFHLVALFDPSVDQKYVESFLGFINVVPAQHGQQDALCTLGPYEVIQKIHERQGLAILAHIDRPKGAFREKSKVRENGKLSVPVDCSKLFNEAQYDAVECVDGRWPDGFDAAHQIKRYPPFYQASDNPDPVKPTKHSADGLGTLYSWFKLDQIDLEGLRQCFADPEVRIRLMSEKEDVGHSKVVSLRIGGSGFLRNQCLEFHDGLNSIIGGKGVGKSLAVEFLRFALDQPSTDPNLAADLAGKLEKRLEPGNTIEVVYQIADGTQYRIQRTYQGTSRGRDARPNSTCTCTNLVSGAEYTGDISQMFPILAYSQTEVIKIAENPQAQLELIDRFVDTREHERTIAELGAKLNSNDRLLTQAIQAKGALDSCELQISTLKEKIDAIARSLADPLFDAMKAAEAKKRTLEARHAYVGDLMVQVQSWQALAATRTLTALPGGSEDDPELNAVQARAAKTRQHILDSFKALLGTLEAESQAIAAIIAAWMPTFKQVEADYHALLVSIGGDRKAKEQERRRLEDEKAAL